MRAGALFTGSRENSSGFSHPDAWHIFTIAACFFRGHKPTGSNGSPVVNIVHHVLKDCRLPKDYLNHLHRILRPTAGKFQIGVLIVIKHRWRMVLFYVLLHVEDLSASEYTACMAPASSYFAAN